MTRDRLLKLVYHRVLHRKGGVKLHEIDWEQVRYDCENIPDATIKKIKNDSRVQFCEQEVMLLEEDFDYVATRLNKLKTEHEAWREDEDGIFRYRDSESIEKTKMMCGPEGDSIEEWGLMIYKVLKAYREEARIQLGIALKGEEGEKNIAAAIANSKYTDNVLHNIVLNCSIEGEKTNEIDTYVFTKKGIFVLEVKNYGSENKILRANFGDKWYVVEKDTGKILKEEKNPRKQNERHVKATEMKVYQNFGRKIPVYSLIVIGNDKVTLEVEAGMNVIGVNQLVAYIDNMPGEEVLSDHDLWKLKRAFEEEDIGGNRFEVVSYRESAYHMRNIYDKIRPYLESNQEMKKYYYKMQPIWVKMNLAVIILAIVLMAFVVQDVDLVLGIILIGACIVAACSVIGFILVKAGKLIQKIWRSINGD